MTRHGKQRFPATSERSQKLRSGPHPWNYVVGQWSSPDHSSEQYRILADFPFMLKNVSLFLPITTYLLNLRLLDRINEVSLKGCLVSRFSSIQTITKIDRLWRITDTATLISSFTCKRTPVENWNRESRPGIDSKRKMFQKNFLTHFLLLPLKPIETW